MATPSWQLKGSTTKRVIAISSVRASSDRWPWIARAGRGERGVPLTVLIFGLGYAMVWVGFSAGAAIAQWALHQTPCSHRPWRWPIRAWAGRFSSRPAHIS